MYQTSFLSDRSHATFSIDSRYRYGLWRRWDDGPIALWIMLNPSTADEVKNDPTIRRCIGYSKAWGYSGIAVGNIFALRSTDPSALRRSPDPVGPDNSDYLLSMASAAALTVCAWGVHGAYKERGVAVHELLIAGGVSLSVLGFTKGGHPVHPLYQKASLKPQQWAGGAPVRLAVDQIPKNRQDVKIDA